MTETACSHSAQDAAHHALFYGDDTEYVEGVLEFAGPALRANEPVAMAVLPSRAEVLRQPLSLYGSEVEMLDMLELGRNPARIIPAVEGLVQKHAGRRLHYVGEPIWPGRTPDEIREATRHEALINLAWPGVLLRVLCPYNAAALDPAVLADAERTHPHVIHEGHLVRSGAYSGPGVPVGCEDPLSTPPPGASTLHFDIHDLSSLRAVVAEEAAAAGLPGDRASDVVLAVNEVATNTIRYAQPPGLLTTWRRDDQLVCQIEDSGHIADPLAGRRPPVPGVGGGLGLWMVNQLCDLVEVRSSAEGTVIRMLAGPA